MSRHELAVPVVVMQIITGVALNVAVAAVMIWFTAGRYLLAAIFTALSIYWAQRFWHWTMVRS